MQVSDRGVALTESSEGCRLKAYQDTGGVWTIGYGHTGGVVPNSTITQQMAETLLIHDIQYAANIVNTHALPCTQAQFDALTDFVFNVGPSQFLSSHLYSYHKAGRYDKAADEFPKWKYDNGKVEQGLVERRAKERALYTLQEPQADHPHTDEPVHSVVFAADPSLLDQLTGDCQSSEAQPSPISDTAPVSNTPPSVSVLQGVAEKFRKLIAGAAGTKD